MRNLMLILTALLALTITAACTHRVIVNDCKKVQDDDQRWVCVQKLVP